jgi:hypothetical protein
VIGQCEEAKARVSDSDARRVNRALDRLHERGVERSRGTTSSIVRTSGAGSIYERRLSE